MDEIVVVLSFRAKAGEEDAVVALHEDWQRRLLLKTSGYLWGELLSEPSDPRRFVSLARYESEAACRAAAQDPEHGAWYERLLSLLDGAPSGAEFTSAWRARP